MCLLQLIVALALAAVVAEPEADASAQYLSYYDSPGSNYGSYYGYPGSYYGQRYYGYPGTYYGQRWGNGWENNNRYMVSVFKREAEAEAEADPAYYRTYGYGRPYNYNVRPYNYNVRPYNYNVRPSGDSYGKWW